jgi:obg-like ATPase 1
MGLGWQIFEWVKEHGGEPIIPFSGVLEAKLFDMPDDEKAAYLKEVMHNSDCPLTERKTEWKTVH